MTEHIKRAMIKAAAKDLFFRLGLNKTSMADIAVQSGMAKPTLYYYYENKEALFDEIVLEEARVFLNQIEKEIANESSAGNRVICFFEKTYKGLTEHAKNIAGMPEVVCNTVPNGRPVVRKIKEMMLDTVKKILSEGKNKGEIKTISINETAEALMNMMGFLTIEWINKHEEQTRDGIFREAMRFIRIGLTERN